MVSVSRLDFPESLRPSGVKGAAARAAAGGGEAGGAPAWAAWWRAALISIKTLALVKANAPRLYPWQLQKRLAVAIMSV